jgi:peptidylprolyl isomerase/FKBP-type peptidyl-prolyl cis-trans isomerase FklB
MNRRTLLIGATAVLGLSACKKKTQSPAANPADAQYLVDNAKKPGVITTASGLQYKVLRQGPAGGMHPAPQDEVKVNYEGRLVPTKDKSGKETPGMVFDSSYDKGQPAIFEVDMLVPGWTEALQLMKPGDMFELTVPAKLGYGDEGAGGVIPPGATLIFKMELLDIMPHPGAAGAH